MFENLRLNRKIRRDEKIQICGNIVLECFSFFTCVNCCSSFSNMRFPGDWQCEKPPRLRSVSFMNEQMSGN